VIKVVDEIEPIYNHFMQAINDRKMLDLEIIGNNEIYVRIYTHEDFDKVILCSGNGRTTSLSAPFCLKKFVIECGHFFGRIGVYRIEKISGGLDIGTDSSARLSVHELFILGYHAEKAKESEQGKVIYSIIQKNITIRDHGSIIWKDDESDMAEKIYAHIQKKMSI